MSVSLLQGDCLELLPTLTGINAVVTDPPFGVSLELFSSRRSKERKGWVLAGDETQDVGQSAIVRFFELGLPIVAFAHPSRPWMGEWHQYLVWDKGPGVGIGGGKTRPWKQTWELIQVANVTNYNGKREAGILKHWVSPNFRKDFEFHPCQKPVPLLRAIIEKISQPGDTICDPFMGSGSTGVACVEAGRNFIGIELDEGYFKVAEKRIAEAQAQPALLEAAG